MKTRLLATLTVLGLLLPSYLLAQALPNLALSRVRYNSVKTRMENQGQLQGELKARIDAVDTALAVAARQGNTGETRRLLGKGTTLLAGDAWTPETDYAYSLVLRSDRVVVDPADIYTVRLEQIYRPDIELSLSLSAVATLAPASLGRQPERLQQLGSFEGISRDLREAPFFFDLDLSEIPDGNYQLGVSVIDKSRSGPPLGTAQVAISVRKGLNDLVTRLQEGAASAPASVRADILYPVDRMTQVNRGRIELRTFNPRADFAAAEEVLAASRGGKDPFLGRTGDIKRHYLLETANEIMPYRLYIPAAYDGSRAFPLIVALHGLGGTEDGFFDNYNADFPRLAEQHGYIVVTALGYRVDGSYGWGLGNPPPDPNTRMIQQHSEEDVMAVLARVQQDYRIDSNRIYLTGHSMGAIGTWKLAPKYPDIWAAIGMFAGSGAPATMEQMRHIPQYVVHGDADPTVNVRGSRMMVARMKELEMTYEYHEVPGGDHSSVVAPGFPGLFDFFDRYQKH